MRKQLPAFHPYGQYDAVSSQHDQINNANQPIYHIPAVDTAFDLATLFVIAAVLLLSLLSLSFIFHLRLRCRGTCQLREFNNLWSVRVLLVLFISYWAINEIIRLPFFGWRYLTLSEQDDLCKLHVVFSLGFLEPGFLMTLLFIIKESVNEGKRSEIGSVLWVLLMSLPTLILEILAVFLKGGQASLVWVDDEGKKGMSCRFPLVSSMVFGGFAVVYSVGIVAWCWRVVSLVINKKMRWRINLLGLTVIISLLVQSVCLGVVSVSPASVWYGGVLLGMFVSLAMCAGVAEIVLVIKPIVEALVAADCEWN